MQTKITITIDHTRPIPELCDLVAGRAYTLQHVEGVEAAIVTDDPFGFFKAEPFGWTDCAETDEGAKALFEVSCSGNRFADLNALVVKWASDRKIVQNSNVLAQAKKSLEEVGELVEAAAQAQALEPFEFSNAGSNLLYHAEADYRDAVGDTMVTLLVGCATAGIDPLDCLQLAYDEIKDRKGHLDANGVFHKQT